MKTKKYTLFCLNLIVLFCSVFFINVKGQTLEEENNKVLERMDKESFVGKIVLNKAIALDEQDIPGSIELTSPKMGSSFHPNDTCQ
ncbi:hypothetical protein DYBT9275_02312 [Dyadobacter sp. CECT 9275]|uniref:Uncharacterized protein n=1 Tax=Dyadobacter helix TaxID=2822344 RepID=A0A916N5T3_9BACT|nr:hypothetical protein [Dyadobacter sp. CECT 9275]CAG4999809.1 hypothetical protein DYBT9275_02312 [Dyadobacter sp. CECT 9275]